MQGRKNGEKKKRLICAESEEEGLKMNPDFGYDNVYLVKSAGAKLQERS